jgi:ketosteroid isomerase-like protein
MKRYMVLLLVLGVTIAGTPREPPANRSPDSQVASAQDAGVIQEVKQVAEVMKAASERVDVEAVLTFFSTREDVSVTQNGRTVMGMQAIAMLLRPAFAQMQSQKFAPETTRFIVLNQQHVLLIDSGRCSAIMKSGQTISASYANSTILSKEQKGWRVMHANQFVQQLPK